MEDGPLLVMDAAIKDKVRCAWEKWQLTKQYYSDELVVGAVCETTTPAPSWAG